MLRRLTTGGDAVQVVVGKAGSGKSLALAAAAPAWTASGLPVLGAAVAARAASELSTATGMPALTVARLLSQRRPPRARRQRRGGCRSGWCWWWTRPACSAPARWPGCWATCKQAHGSLVLVGDHHQLPELDAGGAFAALAHRLDPITLQHQPPAGRRLGEVRALDELRTGDVPTALEAVRRAPPAGRLPHRRRAEVRAGRRLVDPPDHKNPHRRRTKRRKASGKRTDESGARNWGKSRVASDPSSGRDARRPARRGGRPEHPGAHPDGQRRALCPARCCRSPSTTTRWCRPANSGEHRAASPSATT